MRCAATLFVVLIPAMFVFCVSITSQSLCVRIHLKVHGACHMSAPVVVRYFVFSNTVCMYRPPTCANEIYGELKGQRTEQ